MELRLRGHWEGVEGSPIQILERVATLLAPLTFWEDMHPVPVVELFPTREGTHTLCSGSAES